MLVFLISVCTAYQYSGKINPEGALSISNTITNRNNYADYIFTFSLDTAVPSGGILEINFPSQFDTNLGVAGDPVCSPYACSLDDKTLTLDLASGLSPDTVYSISIQQVKNPDILGGTGNFELVTYFEGYILDMNLIFGSIGISDYPASLQSTFVNVPSTESSVAGEISKLIFNFKVSQTIPANSWVLLTFPDDGFYFTENPTCTSYSSAGVQTIPGELYCALSGNEITLTGISDSIPASYEVSLRITVTLPKYSLLTDKFEIKIFRENTYSLFEKKTGIAGITITEGTFFELTFAPLESTYEVARNKVMLYQLRFTTKNPVPAGGEFIIDFPVTFVMGGAFIKYIEYGLDDDTAEVSMSYDIPTRRLVITNFAGIPEEHEVSMILQLQNPSATGLSSPLQIYSMTPTAVIDQDLTTATTTVGTYISPGISVSVSGNTIEIAIKPYTEIPVSGYIDVLIPSEFDLTGVLCELQPWNVARDGAASCTTNSGWLRVQLFVSTTIAPAGSGVFYANKESYVYITLGFPSVAGTYYLEVETYDTTPTKLESGSGTFTVTSPAFSTFTVTPVSTHINSPTVLKVVFSADIEIDLGRDPENPLDKRHYMELQLPTQSSGLNLFSIDLGLGLNEGDSVPCKGIQYLLDNDSRKLNCVITTKPAVNSEATPVIITIYDFMNITLGKTVEFHLAGLHYFQTTGSGSATFTIYQKENRERFDLLTGTYALPSGTNLPTGVTKTSDVTLSNVYAREYSNLSIDDAAFEDERNGNQNYNNPSFILSITTDDDEGYCDDDSVLTCNIDGDQETCSCYQGAKLILIESVINNFNANNNNHYFVIRGLKNRNTVSGTNDIIRLYTVEGTTTRIDHTYSDPFSVTTVRPVQDMLVTISDDCQSCVNVIYELSFYNDEVIPQGGSVLMEFPTGLYNMHYSSPLPYCSSVEIGEVSSYSCTIYSNTVVLDNFSADVPEETFIWVQVKGVKNPAVTGPLGSFTFTTFDSKSYIIEQSSVAGPSLNSVFAMEKISHVTVTATPTNQGALADYDITFTPAKHMAKGTTIEIDFPTKNYGILTNPPDCRVNGGIQLLQSCSVVGKTLKAVINQDYAIGDITIRIYSVRNFVGTRSEEFYIRALYDGVTLQESDEFYIELLSAANALEVTHASLFPKNEAERASFQVTLLPALSFSGSIVIVFPRSFDLNLGPDVDCSAIGLSGYIKCALTSSWTLEISGHHTFEACSNCSIELTVNGIVNPNYASEENTGFFRIGTMETTYYSQLNEYAAELDLSSAAGFLNLYETTASNTYVRNFNNLSFNITTIFNIPNSNYGQIWVEFPTDYVLDGSVVVCKSSTYWAGGSPECQIDFNRVVMTTDPADYAGELILELEDVPNPLTDGTANQIDIKVYDSYNKLVLYRSYSNLQPNFFTYTYPGPIIAVNNNTAFEVARGTVSQYIPITLDYPCSLNLTLQPVSTGFSFIPNAISLQTGDVVAYFRVGVPDDAQDTQHTISWTTTGEYTPAYYTPILKSFFVVTRQTSMGITIDKIASIPRGGSSIPVKIELEAAPYRDLHITLSLKSFHSGISVLPVQVKYLAAEYIGYFSVYATNSTPAISGNIDFTMGGSNSDLYRLAVTSKTFEIVDAYTVAGKVTSTSLIEIKRSYARIQVGTNRSGMLFYAYALRGTLTPTPDELKRQGPPDYSTTDTKYGKIFLNSISSQVLTLDGLEAQTKYTFFAMLEDMLGLQSSVEFYEFETLSRYASAEIKMWFTQSSLSVSEKELAKEVVALILGLHPWRVLDIDDGSSRILQNESRIQYSIYVIDNPFSDEYTEPKFMANRLQDNISTMGALLPNFDSTSTVTGYAIVKSQCIFTEEPTLLGTSSDTSIGFSSMLEEPGYVYAVAIPDASDTGTPFPFQVYRGLDAANRPALNNWIAVDAGESTTLSINGLESQTRYAMYVICGNLHPGYPDLSEAAIKLEWTTDESPTLTANFGFAVAVSLIIMIFI